MARKVNTKYKINDKKVSYKIEEKGYKIFLDDKLWIHQYEPHIPDRSKSYKDNAIAHIEELVNGYEN